MSTDHPPSPGSTVGRDDGTDRRPARALAVAVALTLLGLVAGSLLGAVPVLGAVLVGTTLGLPVLVAALVATMVGYALVGGLYARRHLPVRVAVPGRRDLAYVGAGLVGTLVAVTVLSVVVSVAGLEGAPNAVGVVGEGTPVFLLVVAVLSVLLVGPAEELLFRGAIQGRLRRAFGPAGAVLGASVLFGAVHVPAVVGTVGATLVSVGLVTAVSLVLGYVYERTDNLVVPAAVHGFYNATLLVVAYVSLVGTA
jgi:membrane protease YdiL (CAAX protease family)